MRAAGDDAALASTVFDSHLCVAEYLLYGPTALRRGRGPGAPPARRADGVGARPAAALPTTLVAGEASLLAGDLEVGPDLLTEAVDLHRALGADSGAAHALQRLAEVELAAGDRAEAERLLPPGAGAGPLVATRPPPAPADLRHARRAAPDRDAALAVVDEAAEAADPQVTCRMCHVMIAVPAAITCAEGGRLPDARTWLAEAERSAALWQGTAWRTAVREAHAHLAVAEDDPAGAGRLLVRPGLFDDEGQPPDARRCRARRQTWTGRAAAPARGPAGDGVEPVPASTSMATGTPLVRTS